MLESALCEPPRPLIVLFICIAKKFHTFQSTCRFFVGILCLQCASFICGNTEAVCISNWIQLAQNHSYLYKAHSSVCTDAKNVRSMTQHWHLKSSILSFNRHAQLTSLFSSATYLILIRIMETFPYLGTVTRKVYLYINSSAFYFDCCLHKMKYLMIIKIFSQNCNSYETYENLCLRKFGAIRYLGNL